MDSPLTEEQPSIVEKYRPIDEAKNLRLFLALPDAFVGDMFNIMNGETLKRGYFKEAVVEKRSNNKEVSVKVSMNSNSFASRFDLLGIVGIQKIFALTGKQPGIIDFLVYPPSKEFRYCAVVLKRVEKVTKLDTNNELLRDCLANIDFGPWTHLLSSLTHGLMFIFLLVFPNKVFDNHGQYEMGRAIEKFFNAENEDETPFRCTTKVFVFSNTFRPVQANLSLDQLKEVVQKIHNHPDQLMNGNEKLEWSITSLNQFQPALKMRLPTVMSDGLMNESVEVLIDIESRLETYESMAVQVKEYAYVFSDDEHEQWVRIYESEKQTLTPIKKEMVESIWKHRQNQIGDRVLSGKLLKFRQGVRELSDADSKHIYLMKERIKEVEEWKKSGLQFVGRDFDMFVRERNSPIAYVFLFKDRSGTSFGQNLRHMKTLPANTSRLLVDSKLMPLQEFSEDFTGILKLENGEVVEHDVLDAFEFRRRSSVGRCPTSELRADLKMSDKYSNFEIPCPSCNDEDCFWLCDRCLRPLQYDWEGYLCCECGLAPPHSFEFWCKNYRKHGDGYSKFEPAKLNDLLKELRTFKDKIILILGQTGVGKSTWINSIAHYLTYEALDDALSVEEPMYLVPSSFTMVDENYKKVPIVVGEESSTERFNKGKSATREPKIHSFAYKGGKLKLIDTPGVGDTGGIEQDKKNFAKILDYISVFKELHGICILMPPNESRMTPSLCYCINQLLSQLHRNAVNNIVFCLTNTQGTLYRPGETSTTLETFLDELHQDRDILMNPINETLYCMDNCVFRYLCAKRQSVQFDDKVHGINVEAWNKSRAETYRLIEHFTGIKSHSTAETATLNETRRIILSLAKRLALITKNIQTNVTALNKQKESVEALTGDEKNFRDQLKITRWFINPRELSYPRTVCVSKSCVEVKKDRYGNNQQVFEKPCHDHCYLEGVTVETYPNEALMKCWAMGGNGKCKICGCSWDMHMHVTWYHTEESEEVEDEAVKRDLQSIVARKEAKLGTIRKCEKRIEYYEQEQKQINNAAARFAVFLEKNAIILYNDSIEEYIKVEISNAEAAGAIDGNFARIENLRRALDAYREEKRIIQTHAAANNDPDADLALELEKVQAEFSALCSLPLTGSEIKAMLDLELNGQQKQLEHHHQQSHFNAYEHRAKALYKTRSDKLLNS